MAVRYADLKSAAEQTPEYWKERFDLVQADNERLRFAIADHRDSVDRANGLLWQAVGPTE